MLEHGDSERCVLFVPQIPVLTRGVGSDKSLPADMDSRPAHVAVQLAFSDMYAVLALAARARSASAGGDPCRAARLEGKDLKEATTLLASARGVVLRLGLSAGGASAGLAGEEALTEARRGYQGVIPRVTSDLAAGFSVPQACWPVAAALLEALHGNITGARSLMHNVLRALRSSDASGACVSGGVSMTLALAPPGVLPASAPLALPSAGSGPAAEASRFMAAAWCEILAFVESAWRIAPRGALLASGTGPRVTLADVRRATMAALAEDPGQPRLMQLLAATEGLTPGSERFWHSFGAVLAVAELRRAQGRRAHDGRVSHEAVRAALAVSTADNRSYARCGQTQPAPVLLESAGRRLDRMFCYSRPILPLNCGTHTRRLCLAG